MGNRIDITGQRFGHLTVLRQSPAPNRHGELKWVVRCDCGAHTVKVGNALRRGKIKSCSHTCEHNPFRNHGSEHAAKVLLRSEYKSSAKRRGLAWELSDEEFYSVVTAPCHYCGIPPSRNVVRRQWVNAEKGTQFNLFSKKTGHTSGILANGVDRKDSRKGYVQGNVLACCAECNYAKLGQSYEHFMNWINRLMANALKQRSA